MISALLIALGCVLAPISLLGHWVAEDLTSSEDFLASVAPLAGDPDIQDVVADRVTGVMTQRLRGLGVSAAGDLVRVSVRTEVSGKYFPAAWEEMNDSAHRRFLTILRGEGTRDPSLRSDTVFLDLNPVCELVRGRLLDAGLGAAARLPEMHPTIRLVSSADLIRLDAAYHRLDSLRWALPLMSSGLIVAGVLLARDRGAAIVGAGLGLAGGMMLLAVALSLARNVYLPDSPSHALPAAAAVALFDAVTGPLRAGLRMFFTAGLLTAGAVFAARVRAAGRRLPDPPRVPSLTSPQHPRRTSSWADSRAGRGRP
ncbi:hypothetical protein FHS43_003919 [Streptosporangium becharense]|uniref:Uncharacterized protein n=1 Tax=Streptosporangium becharense TaxID=1816182 RepID=A0A7W9IHJ3_9ACTN|nr:hypothetical protein [Streptosporangium becharense]MBB2912636.1 hypothetical protein [Streptosporangium becharense]MBB5820535.1 hypothetical protein [Streptosporangium becharense]